MVETIATVRPQKIRDTDIPVTHSGKTDCKPATPVARENSATRELRESYEATARKAAQALQDYLKSRSSNLKIQVHEPTGRVVVEVVSGKDGKVIREIPPKEWLNLAEKMQNLAGVLLNEIV